MEVCCLFVKVLCNFNFICKLNYDHKTKTLRLSLQLQDSHQDQDFENRASTQVSKTSNLQNHKTFIQSLYASFSRSKFDKQLA